MSRLGINCFFVFIFFCLKITSADEIENLNQVLKYPSKTPLIAILLKRNVKTVEETNMAADDDITPDVNSVAPPHDRELYNFYHVLRTTQENEDLDPKAAEVFDKTGNILRAALRIRCNKLDTCVKKCPRKKKFTCTLTCKEVYDDYDVCEKPKICKRPKCGKTMPPYWILRK